MNKKIILVDQIAKINYKYTFSLVNELLNNGVDVKLVLDMKENDECKCDTYNIFLTDEKNVSKLKKVRNLFTSYKKIRQIIKQEKIDTLHIQWINFSPIEYHLLKRIAKKTKIVMTVHDILPFNEKKYDKHFYRKIYRLPSKLIIQAKSNMERFNSLFPEYADKTIYIPLGNFLKYAEVHDVKESREKLNIDLNKFTFLFFGQIKVIKGVDTLLEAFSLFHKKYPDTQLVVAGKTWKADEELYKEIISRNNLTENELKWDIRFIPDEDLGYYYSASDIVVLPYKDLYQSGVVQLVYAFGKCPIVSDLPSFLEVVDENTGYIFKSKDVDSLYQKMEQAYLNKANNNSLAKVGYKKIEENFSWVKIAKDIINNCY